MYVEHSTLDGDIPDQARSFYDPDHTFASSDPSGDTLLKWLDAKRASPVTVPYLGMVSTRQLVALELAHTGIINEANINEQSWLGLDKPVIEQTMMAAQSTAQDIARRCLESIVRIRSNRPKPALAQTSDITLAGAVLAANAHKGQMRLNGKPYYSHPQGVALLLGRSYKIHLQPDSDPSLPLYEFEGLLHDGFEDSMPRNGLSFLSSPNVIVSPLVLHETLTQLGVEPAIARRQAVGMLALTKTIGPNGSMSYDSYIKRFEHYAQQIPTKLGDLQYNYKIDSKVPLIGNNEGILSKNRKIFIKKELYNDAQQDLLHIFSNSDQIVGDDWLNKQLFAARLINFTHKDLEDARKTAGWSDIDPLELIDAYEGTDKSHRSSSPGHLGRQRYI